MTSSPSQVQELIERLRNGCYCHELKVSPAQKCEPCKAADAIRDLRKQDEIHWKTRRTLLAERDALREALREICHRIGNDRSDLAEELRDFARAALAAQERKP